MVWGAITGSWFAIPVQNLPFVLRSIILPPFNGTGPVAEFPLFLQSIFKLPPEVPVDDLKTKWNIQFLCFTVGMVQLISARGMNIKKQLPSLAAVAQLGWILALAGIYFLVLYMLLKMPPPSFVQWFIAAGIILNFIFAEQHGGNFLSNVVKSLTNFFGIFLKAIGGFADIISYIRLFAVGMAGGMIAQTFNSMAIPAEGLGSFSLGFILKLIIAAVVLILGHSLNLLMSTLSVIIHGVRLNLLEYAGNHLGMDWSGYAYEPFVLRQKKQINREA
jgi:V/A-type H+-transporting ATPase subunit I